MQKFRVFIKLKDTKGAILYNRCSKIAFSLDFHSRFHFKVLINYRAINKQKNYSLDQTLKGELNFYIHDKEQDIFVQIIYLHQENTGIKQQSNFQCSVFSPIKAAFFFFNSTGNPVTIYCLTSLKGLFHCARKTEIEKGNFNIKEHILLPFF